MAPLRWLHRLLGNLGIGVFGANASGLTDPGLLVLRFALSFVGTRERGGTNRGPEVDRWNLEAGAPLGSAWCATFMAAMVRLALGPRVPSWLTLSPAVVVWESEFRATNHFISITEARATPQRVKPGMFGICERRDAPKPQSWQRHIFIVREPPDAQLRFGTVEGNTGPASDQVTDAMPRSLNDKTLLGFGWLPELEQSDELEPP